MRARSSGAISDPGSDRGGRALGMGSPGGLDAREQPSSPRRFRSGCGRHGGASGPSPGEESLNTVSMKTGRSARTVFRKLASGGRVRALPQRLRRAGRATIPIPGTTWVSPPVLHPGRPTLRRSPDPVRPPCLRSETPLHPLPPPLRIAGRASLPCDGTGRLWGRRDVRRADDGVFSGRAVKSAGWRRGECRQSTDCQHRAAGRSRSVDRRDGHGQQVARFVADPDGGFRVAQDGQPRGGDQGVTPPPPRLPPPPPRPLRPRRDQTASSSVPGSGLQAPWGC